MKVEKAIEMTKNRLNILEGYIIVNKTPVIKEEYEYYKIIKEVLNSTEKEKGEHK